ncbi:MAG: hypothetical protein KatS3mg082_2631 [Nitrospiraceae bacterium]|nr:MAG: hypothetical protein KatS3mg082_2631 [Nitrospiraceae bacterium]
MNAEDRARLREAVFASYGRDWQDATERFQPGAADRWGLAYAWYLRGWLPTARDAAIADLACGQGRFLHWLKSLGYTNLSGVDISADQVALARQVVPSVEKADALGWLAQHPERFDCLIGLDIVEHFTRDEAVRFLELCFVALKPSGRLILQTPNADSPFGLQHRYNDISHEWAFNVNQLTRLLRRAGFTAIEPREQGAGALGLQPRLYGAVRHLARDPRRPTALEPRRDRRTPAGPDKGVPDFRPEAQE